MPLQFKTKPIPHVPDVEAVNLSNFVLSNKCFFNITCSVLERRTTPITDIRERVLGLFEFQNSLRINPKANDYLDLMEQFYNTTSKRILNDRRGAVLELLIQNCYPPAAGTQCTMIPESRVYYLGRTVSKKDIDVVFRDQQIELIECKSTVMNFLQPLSTRRKAKLSFIQHVRNISARHSITCDTFLATYSERDFVPLKILGKAGFNAIGILTRKEIKSRLGA